MKETLKKIVKQLEEDFIVETSRESEEWVTVFLRIKSFSDFISLWNNGNLKPSHFFPEQKADIVSFERQYTVHVLKGEKVYVSPNTPHKREERVFKNIHEATEYVKSDFYQKVASLFHNFRIIDFHPVLDLFPILKKEDHVPLSEESLKEVESCFTFHKHFASFKKYGGHTVAAPQVLFMCFLLEFSKKIGLKVWLTYSMFDLVLIVKDVASIALFFKTELFVDEKTFTIYREVSPVWGISKSFDVVKEFLTTVKFPLRLESALEKFTENPETTIEEMLDKYKTSVTSMKYGL